MNSIGIKMLGTLGLKPGAVISITIRVLQEVSSS